MIESPGLVRLPRIFSSHGSWLLAALVFAGCASVPSRASAVKVEVWLTKPDRSALIAAQRALNLARGKPRGAIIVDTTRRYQQMAGFGAAMSDSSAHLIQSRLSPVQREALLRDLFGPSPGAGFSLTRLTIGGSDFSLSHYSYNDVPAGTTDPELRQFSISPAKTELLPVLREALALNPRLTIMATPWSAPAWMKTSGSLIKGTLREEYQRAFAAYLRRTVEAFGEEGVPIHYLSIQNEPDHEPEDYPGMRLSAEQRARIIGHHVGPEFARAGLKTKILEWDHNWDQPEQPLAVLADRKAARFINGVAWHCYKGEVSAQSRVPKRHPGKEVFFTECSGGEWSPSWNGGWQWTMRNLIIGATRHWARGILLWNLALDEKHGPRLGGCSNCRGVVTIDSRTGEVTRNAEYYALAHLSRFVSPGAWRIASTSPVGQVLTVAFQDDKARVLLAFNEGAAAAEIAVASGDRHFRYTLPAKAAATFRW